MVKLEENNYKFKGYCEDINDWVYGGIIHITNEYNDEGDEYTVDDYYIITEDGVQFKVNKNSICQSTGIKDSNNNIIYNKDILYINSDTLPFNEYIIWWNQNQLRYYLYAIDRNNLNKLGGILEADLRYISTEVKSNIFSTPINYDIFETN